MLEIRAPEQATPADAQGRCEQLLRALPQWFAIESALTTYAAQVTRLPTAFALRRGEVVGFITLRQHAANAWEVECMAVHPAAHRQGIGRALIDWAVRWLRARDARFLTVRTLSPAVNHFAYAETRAFYAEMGFQPIMQFDDYWSAQNPCLAMLRELR
ncbi:MAG: GNAT family N-acetyltransferase [Burkholderiales bacterium]|nr:GNAT family N-acetyltransferase [Burkholderiales bacterium]